MSASGALVTSHLPLPLHTVVLVQIEEPDAHQALRRVTLTGEVSRVTADGFAIEWSEFAPHTLRAILRVMERRHERPRQPKIDVG